jgi:hypothetical protein
MSNNFWNFEIPYFNEQFGTDWSSFTTIVDTNIDTMFDKTFELYWLKDITRMPAMAVDYAIRLRGIETDPSETIAMKKSKLRNFNKDFKSKGMQDTYLDYQEIIVGVRGEVYNGYIFGSFVWDTSCWPISGSPESTDYIWSTIGTKFDIYMDCKTTDSGLLDEMVAIFRQSFLLPAFYQIYLTDSSYNILRTV